MGDWWRYRGDDRGHSAFVKAPKAVERQELYECKSDF